MGRFSNTEIQEMKKLYRKQSLEIISEKMGVSTSTIRRVLIKNGVKMRNAIETRKLLGHDIGSHLRGKKKKPFSKKHKENIRKAKLGKGKGTTLKPSGYIEITMGPNKGRLVHVIEMEKLIGRRIEYRKECVHHIDGDKTNNHIDNLAFMTTKAHAKLHRLQDQMAGNHRERDKKGRFL